MDDESLESIFKNGLKLKLKTLVRMLKPRGLPEMIETALEMEASIMSRMVNVAFVQELTGQRNQSYSQNHSQNSIGWKGRSNGEVHDHMEME